MNWADWTILTIIAISSLFSLKRGFVREALSLVTWVSAFIVARLFSQSLSFLLEPYIETPSVRVVAAFAILFIATLIVGVLINKLIGALIEATGLSATDRIRNWLWRSERRFNYRRHRGADRHESGDQ